MRHFVIALSLLAIGGTLSANPQPHKFSCTHVGGIPEWIVFIDLNKHLAGFFDNDTLVKIPLKSAQVDLAVTNNEKHYRFEGKDTSNGSHGRLEIFFNQTKMEASVTLNSHSVADRAELKALKHCRPNKKIDL